MIWGSAYASLIWLNRVSKCLRVSGCLNKKYFLAEESKSVVSYSNPDISCNGSQNVWRAQNDVIPLNCQRNINN